MFLGKAVFQVPADLEPAFHIWIVSVDSSLFFLVVPLVDDAADSSSLVSGPVPIPRCPMDWSVGVTVSDDCFVE